MHATKKWFSHSESDAAEPSKRLETEGDHEPDSIDSEQRRLLLKDEEKDLTALSEVTRGEEKIIPVVSEKEYEAAFEAETRGDQEKPLEESDIDSLMVRLAEDKKKDVQEKSLEEVEAEIRSLLAEDEVKVEPKAAEKKVEEVDEELIRKSLAQADEEVLRELVGLIADKYQWSSYRQKEKNKLL